MGDVRPLTEEEALYGPVETAPVAVTPQPMRISGYGLRQEPTGQIKNITPKPWIDPYVKRNPARIRENFQTDVEDVMKTGGAVSGLVGLRAREAIINELGKRIKLPGTVSSMGGELVRIPAAGKFGLSTPQGMGTRESDLIQASNLATQMGDYVGNRYGKPFIEPFAQGNISLTEPVKHNALGMAYTDKGLPYGFNALSFPKHLAREFGKAPLATGLDLLPTIKMPGQLGAIYTKALNKVPGVAGVAGPPARLTDRGLRTAAKVSTHLQEVAASPVTGAPTSVLSPWLAAIMPKGVAAHKFFHELLSKHELKRLADIQKAELDLRKAFKDLSAREQVELTAVIEKTDDVLLAKYAADPALEAKARRAITTVLEYNRKYEQSFQIGQAMHQRTIYGPQLLKNLEAARLKKLAELKQLYAAATTPEKRALLKARLQDASKPVTAADLSKPKYKKALDAIQQAEEASHELPTGYAAVATKEQVARAIAAANKPMGGGLEGRLVKTAVKHGKGEIKTPYEQAPGEIPGILQERQAAKIGKVPFALSTNKSWNWKLFGKPPKRGSNWQETMNSIRQVKHELNLKNLTLAREVQRTKYEAIKGFVQDLVELGHESGETPKHWSSINFADEMTQAGMDAEKAVNMFGKDTKVTLPAELIGRLKEIIHGTGKRNAITGYSGVDPIIHYAFTLPNRIFTNMLFNKDLTFGFGLHIQTRVLQAGTVRTGKEVVTMLVSEIIARRPDAADLIKARDILGHGNKSDINLLAAATSWEERMARATQSSEALSARLKLPSLQKPLEAIEKAKAPFLHAGAKISRMNSAFDRLKSKLDYEILNDPIRRTAAIEFLLYRSKAAPPSFKRLFADMLNADEALLEAAEDLSNPAKMKALHGHLKGVYGDYSAIANMQRRGINTFIPISAWAAHAMQIIIHMPIRYPQKAAMLSLLRPLADQIKADRHGRLPIRDKKGHLVTDPNGRVKYFSGIALDATKSGLEVVQDAGTLVFSFSYAALPSEQIGTPQLQIPSALTPILGVASAWKTNVDPETGLNFADIHPDLRKKGGHAQVVYKGDKRYYVTNKGKLVDSKKYFGPSPPYLAAQYLFRKQLKPLQQQRAGQYEPTLFTGLQLGGLKYGRMAPKLQRGKPLKADKSEQILKLFRMGAQGSGLPIRRPAP